VILAVIGLVHTVLPTWYLEHRGSPGKATKSGPREGDLQGLGDFVSKMNNECHIWMEQNELAKQVANGGGGLVRNIFWFVVSLSHFCRCQMTPLGKGGSSAYI
jgi:hypothetical protein